jgi:hypothetical protein
MVLCSSGRPFLFATTHQYVPGFYFRIQACIDLVGNTPIILPSAILQRLYPMLEGHGNAVFALKELLGSKGDGVLAQRLPEEDRLRVCGS